MRLAFILLFAGMMQVSANTYAQKFTLNKNKISIKQIFREVKRQIGYDVIWQPGKFNANKLIDVNFENAPLAQVINTCIGNDELNFKIEDNTVVIIPKQEVSVKNVNSAPQDSLIYKGIVLDEKGKPLPGASVKIMGTNRATFTTSLGNFAIYAPQKGSTLVFSYIGYVNQEVTLAGLNSAQLIRVRLIPGQNQLGEVSIVSTGYQDLPKERATGSFEQISKEQLQHSTDPNLLRRLEGITTSMDFNNQLVPNNSSNVKYTGLGGQYAKSPLANLTIRGRNTLNRSNTAVNQSGSPLIVIDGIATPYSIDQVNPNNVESITILKDAAAASIWGSRAANGVIVIKTKSGNYQRPLAISFNSNLAITEKLDLFYNKTMSASEYIDAEIIAFNKQYNPNDPNSYIGPPNLSQAQLPVSPVYEILNSGKMGLLTPAEVQSRLNVLRQNDIRDDYTKYILRDAVTQSYSLSLDGGSKNVASRFSVGYDNTSDNTVKSGNNRLVLGYNISAKPLKGLEITGDISYNLINTNSQSGKNPITAVIAGAYYPYTKLADDQGNPLPIIYRYRPAFLDLLKSTYGDKLLSMQFVPLKDINEGYLDTKSQNINMLFGTKYHFNSIFSVGVNYNYNRGFNQENGLDNTNSFYVRNLVNLFTTRLNYVDPISGAPDPTRRQIPSGGIYSPGIQQTNNQTLRGQLNAEKTWSEKHQLSAIAGVDAAQNYILNTYNTYYGYNERTKTFNNRLNFYDTYLPNLFADAITGLSGDRIPSLTTINDFRVRTFSIYSNAAYTYNRRYTISASFRQDYSSEFGQGADQKSTPFYSIGGSWNINNEKFYNLTFLPLLKLRATFGYNGNVNPAVYSRPTLYRSDFTDSNTQLPYGYTSSGSQGVSNINLRPEKTGTLNLGIDFGFKGNRVSGSIEYYNKHTTDLLSGSPVDPTTGFNTIIYNVADLNGQGVDLTINSLNLQLGLFRWNSNFLFSWNNNKVLKVYSTSADNAGSAISSTSNYRTGYPLSKLFGLKWAGLDPNTGDPRGYLNGKIVTISPDASGDDLFNQILSAPTSTAHYFGSAVPIYYGSFRNTFSYGSFSISANILYKMGYSFRRPASTIVRYTLLYQSGIPQGAEYSQRWQKPGDEQRTNVPSLTTANNTSRDNMYYFSDINVLKADHIRLQELNLSYSLSKKNWFIKNPRVYANVNNLGLLWKANKLGLDPEANDYPRPRTYSFGFSANF